MEQQLDLQQINEDKLQIAYGIIKKCSDDLKSEGFDHWSDYYKDFETYSKKVKDNRNEVFIIYVDGSPAATFSLSNKPPKYFTEPQGEDKIIFINFFTPINPEDLILYINALGVDPGFQGLGIGKYIIQQIEELAKNRGVKTIRFDTRAEYLPAVKLYNSCGYKIVGTEKVSEKENYNYYEKILN